MTESSQTVGNYEFLGVVDKPTAGVTYKVRNLTTGEFEVLRALPGGHQVLTGEFVEGTTLAELCRQGPISSAEAIRAICDVLSGLEEAHALGIVHRGITAEHVMVTTEGKVKLGGFGLAKPSSDVNLTQAGAVLGDTRYI